MIRKSQEVRGELSGVQKRLSETGHATERSEDRKNAAKPQKATSIFQTSSLARGACCQSRRPITFCRGFMDESLQGVATLVVDDDSGIRKLMARILRLAGAKVSVTSSVEDALQRLEEKDGMSWSRDIEMPRLSGYDLIRLARLRGHRVPMIAVTGFDTPEHRHQVFLDLPARVRVPSHQAV